MSGSNSQTLAQHSCCMPQPLRNCTRSKQLIMLGSCEDYSWDFTYAPLTIGLAYFSKESTSTVKACKFELRGTRKNVQVIEWPRKNCRTASIMENLFSERLGNGCLLFNREQRGTDCFSCFHKCFIVFIQSEAPKQNYSKIVTATWAFFTMQHAVTLPLPLHTPL